MNHYDYLAKILIVGNSGVGKTNILLKFSQNQFTLSHITTIGIDFKVKNIIIGGKVMRMQIWDTAGQERFKTITQAYYKGAHAIILAYSIDDEQSFNCLQNWLKQIRQFADQRQYQLQLQQSVIYQNNKERQMLDKVNSFQKSMTCRFTKQAQKMELISKIYFSFQEKRQKTFCKQKVSEIYNLHYMLHRQGQHQQLNKVFFVPCKMIKTIATAEIITEIDTPHLLRIIISPL